MSKVKIFLVAGALLASVPSFMTAVFAATAHNSQTGANTSSAYGTGAGAFTKQAR